VGWNWQVPQHLPDIWVTLYPTSPSADHTVNPAFFSEDGTLPPPQHPLYQSLMDFD
jgi:hypothetical protein